MRLLSALFARFFHGEVVFIIAFVILLVLFFHTPAYAVVVDDNGSTNSLWAFLLRNLDTIDGSWENPEDLSVIEELFIKFPKSDFSFNILRGLFIWRFTQRVIYSEQTNYDRYRFPRKSTNILEHRVKNARNIKERIVREIVLLRWYIQAINLYRMYLGEFPIPMNERINQLFDELRKQTAGTDFEPLVDYLQVQYLLYKKFHDEQQFRLALDLIMKFQQKYRDKAQLYWFYYLEFYAFTIAPWPSEFMKSKPVDLQYHIEQMLKRICENRPPEALISEGIYGGVRFLARTQAASWYSKFNREKAIEQYSLILNEYPNLKNKWKAQYYERLGYCYRELRKYDEALKAYEKALSLDPNLRNARLGIELVRKYLKKESTPAKSN